MAVTVDLGTLVLSLVGSGGLAVAAARWMAGRMVDHALARDLESHKAALDAQVGAAQAQLEASLRQATESLLGEEAAERSYRFEARKRLYSAIGPLRFQLIDAAVEFRYRISVFGRLPDKVDLTSYFGRSLLFRTARILVLPELIERQMAHADFSADPATLLMLRFRLMILRALSDNKVALDHPEVDWNRQRQHIFRDQLRTLAISMIVAEEGEPERAIRFDEFEHMMNSGKTWLAPLRDMVDGFDPTEMPIFWLRLLAMAETCAGLLAHEPIAIALDPPELDVAALLALSDDPHIQANSTEYLAMLAEFRAKVAVPPLVAT